MVLGIDVENYEPSFNVYLLTWVLYIPLVLLLAKWYFKKDSPTLKKGFRLGIISIIVALLLDGLSILGTYYAGESLDMFMAMYTSWEFYFTIIWVIALTSYAGYEFDATFTKPDKKE